MTLPSSPAHADALTEPERAYGAITSDDSAPNNTKKDDTPPLERRLAAYSVTALGWSGSGFVNQLAGARFELGYTPRFTLAFGLAYANLKGEDGRVGNALPEVLLGYRLPLGRVVGIPFHLGAGYLAKNGPTLRLGSGLDFRFAERVTLELTLLEPMVWVTHDRPECSLDFGAALSVRL